MQAYCFKCRKKVEIKNPQNTVLKNKRPAVTRSLPYLRSKGIPYRQELGY